MTKNPTPKSKVKATPPKPAAVTAAAASRSSPAWVGVAENGNTAVLLTLTPNGEVLDRREVALTHDLPTHPHHHEGSWAVGRYRDSPWARDVTLDEALALVATVRLAAREGAQRALEEVQNAVGAPIGGISVRYCPALPDSAEACIRDNRAQSYADSVMYRQALAQAAEARGWSVFWYDKDTVFDVAATALGASSLTPLLQGMGKQLGAPWQAKHKLAAAAALAATKR